MSSDFSELLSSFNRFGVRYLIVGGHAVMLYSEPRYTKDLDLFIAVGLEDLPKFRSALEEFGFPLTDEAVRQLAQPNKMITIGRPPIRLDFLNQIDGVDFETAWSRRQIFEVFGVQANVLSKQDLIAAKRASGRPQDLLDLERLTSGE